MIVKLIIIFLAYINISFSAQPCVVVIFGSTGDLTSRKLLPAIENLDSRGQMPDQYSVVGFARRDLTNEDFRNQAGESIRSHLFYTKGNFEEDKGYENLEMLLAKMDRDFGTKAK